MSCRYCHKAITGTLFHDECYLALVNLPATRDWVEAALEKFYVDLEQERQEVLQAKTVVDNVEVLKDQLQVPIWLRAWEKVRDYYQLKGVPELPGKPETKEAKQVEVKVEPTPAWGMLKLIPIKKLDDAFRVVGRPHLIVLGTEEAMVCIGQYLLENFLGDWDTHLSEIKPDDLAFLQAHGIPYKFRLQA